jgi:hypothetical protein
MLFDGGQGQADCLRGLITAGALAVIRYAQIHGTDLAFGRIIENVRCWHF